MKFILSLLIILACIGCMDFENKSILENLKDTLYGYITSLDNGYAYLVDNFDVVKNLDSIGYKNTYEKIMSDRFLIEHKVLPGESLDSIILMYNTITNKSDDIEAFRKVVYMENEGKVTSDYNLQSWDYILIPSE